MFMLCLRFINKSLRKYNAKKIQGTQIVGFYLIGRIDVIPVIFAAKFATFHAKQQENCSGTTGLQCSANAGKDL